MKKNNKILRKILPFSSLTKKLVIRSDEYECFYYGGIILISLKIFSVYNPLFLSRLYLIYI